MAAASKSIGRLLPTTSPATYGILGLSCALYVLSLLWTMRVTGLQQPGGGIFGILNGLGGIDFQVLARLGMSGPLQVNLRQPWRFVTAVFLHGSLLHIFFNMWVLMDVGPQLEELYGSARYWFIYVITGIGGYIVSSGIGGRPSIGGSGALLGLIGVMLAITMGRQSAGMRMLRQQLIRWLIYIAIFGFLASGMVDNYAHFGGLATGFLMGRIMRDRPPLNPEERKSAYAMGWLATLLVFASFVTVIYKNVEANPGQSVISVPGVQLPRNSDAVMKS